ncbi:MAG: Peroxisomal membrane protein pex16 [Piccolia ochrophora]|nr:MAG: Peroxisomal membrane protein pex16 [Piccolia ochrophora]
MEKLKQASQRLPEAWTVPPRVLHLYGDFVTKNASSVSQIESALRSLTYIIPGRFRESELASESLHSFIQLLSLYHDSLLARAIARLPPIKRPQPTPHNRYTRFWTQRSPLYRRLALTLQMIQYTELLCEMAAKRRSDKARWRVVVLLEAVKAVCRLLLLRLTHSRPLLSPPLPEREIDPSTLDSPSVDIPDEPLPTEEEEEDSPASPIPSDLPPSSPEDLGWSMPRTGLTLPSLPSSTAISQYLLSKVLTADDIKPAPSLLHRVTGAGQAAEVLHILRPVAYALAMQQLRGDKKSWRPWLLGVSVEYGARQLAKRDFRDRVAGGLRGLTGLEREELGRRGRAMGWWALRGAFYENVTKAWLTATTTKLRNKPLVGLVGGVLEDYEFLWDQYYFSTATL